MQPFASAPASSGSQESSVHTLPSLQSPGQNFKLSMMPVCDGSLPGACQRKNVIPVQPDAGTLTTPLDAGVTVDPSEEMKLCVPAFSTKSNCATLNTAPPLYVNRYGVEQHAGWFIRSGDVLPSLSPRFR